MKLVLNMADDIKQEKNIKDEESDDFMTQKKKFGRKVISYVLTLIMVFSTFTGIVPGTRITAHADTWEGNPYASLVNTTTAVKFNDIDWYIIADDSTAADAGTVTLLAKDPIGKSKFDETDSSKAYSISTVKSHLDSLTDTNGSFADVADAIETVKVKGSDSDTEVDAKLWLLSTDEVNDLYELSDEVKKCSQEDGYKWWLRSPSDYGAANVYSESGSVNDNYGDDVTTELGVRPALKLNLSKVTFDSETKTFAVGAEPISYMAWDAGQKKLVEKKDEEACKDYTVVTASTTIFEDDKWYVVNGEVGVENRINVSGNVNLILVDDSKLTASQGIGVPANGSLTIYGQEKGTGTLDVASGDYNAAELLPYVS